MRRIFGIVLFLVIIFTFCSCGESENNPNNVIETPVTSQSENMQASKGTASVQDSTGTGKEISIEDIYCSESRDTYRNYQLRVRNNMDVPADGIRIQCKLIDSNGDSLDSFEWLFTDIEETKAEQAEHQINDANSYRLKDAYAFKLYSFEIVNYDPWEYLVKADFPEPIIIKLEDIPMK